MTTTAPERLLSCRVFVQDPDEAAIGLPPSMDDTDRATIDLDRVFAIRPWGDDQPNATIVDWGGGDGVTVALSYAEMLELWQAYRRHADAPATFLRRH